jgi:integrase
MHDLVTAFDQLHLPTLKDARPVRCKIRKYFGPLLPLPLESLSVPIILGWVNEIRKHSPCQADGCLTILRTMLNRAIEWEMHKGANVAQLIKRKRSPRRKRYVLKEEMPALVREIDREPLMNQVYFYLLLFVGPRPGEAEVMQRKHIKMFEGPDGMTGLWIKPETKNGEPHHVPLPAFVCQLLKWYLTTLPPHQDYLFSVRPGQPASKGKWHLEWKECRRRAGLLDVQLRDIRRTCATYLLNLQQSKMDLLTLSKGVMNHRDLNTTQIYAQPMMETIQRSMDQNVFDIRRHLQPQGGSHVQNTTVLEPVSVGVSDGASVIPSDSSSPYHGLE